MTTHIIQYSTDGGSLDIGTDAGYASFLNDYGDGVFNVHIHDDIRPDKQGWDFIGAYGGTGFHVYGDSGHDDIIATLQGRWGVFVNHQSNGDMMLVPWDKDSIITDITSTMQSVD
jgi:hypothetical protein